MPFKEDREWISQIGRAAPSALEVHGLFQDHPVTSMRKAHKSFPIFVPTLHASAKQLVQLEFFGNCPVGEKAHVYVYDRYVEFLNAKENE